MKRPYLIESARVNDCLLGASWSSVISNITQGELTLYSSGNYRLSSAAEAVSSGLWDMLF